MINRENAIYMATGIDNTGLYSGKREAIGIIKAMTSEITSFDVFGGLGVSAAMAFAKAAKGSYDFAKEFNRNMMEVASISKEIAGNISGYGNQILDLTRNIPVLASDAAKALYQIVSAGHDGADGMKILEASAKAAVGGVTETATAADAITTILNSYKKSANEAGDVSDMLFTTVRLGKTTFGELGQSISQVAPIAASFGIDIEEVLAAVASLTKQGVPTAQAMTQIRAAISGTAEYLGDAAFEGRSLQDALQLLYEKADGSSTAMKGMLGTQEANNAAMAMTGKNALSAAADLEQLKDSVGAAEDAFKLMASEAGNQMTLLGNNIQAALAPLGEKILKEVSEIAKSFNDAFASGEIEAAISTLTELILAVGSAIVVYKGSVLAMNTATAISKSVTEMVKYETLLYNEAVKAGVVANNSMTASQIKSQATRRHLIATIKTHTVALKANAAAMLTNPYVLFTAAVVGLGYAIYKANTRLSDAEIAQRKFNKEQEEAAKKAQEHKKRIDELIEVSRDASLADLQRVKSLADLRKEYPKIFAEYDIETIKLADILELKQKINEEEAKKTRQQDAESLSSIEAEIAKREKSLANLAGQQGTGGMVKELTKLRLDRDLMLEKQGKDISEQFVLNLKDVDVSELDRYVSVLENKIKGKAEDSKIKLKLPVDIEGNLSEEAIYQVKDVKALIDTVNSRKTAKAEDSSKDSSTYKQDLDKAKIEWEDAKKELSRIENDKNSTTKQFQDARRSLEDAEKKYKELGGQTSSNTSSNDKKKQEEERINNELLALKKQSQQAEINLLAEGSEKKIKQIELNYQNEIARIKKLEGEWSAAQKGKLTDEQSSSISVSYTRAEDTKDKGLADVAKEDITAIKELTDLYQDYAAKRVSIEEQYNKDIKKLEKQRTVANASEIDRALTVAQEMKEKAIESLDMEELQKEIDWSQVFGNLDKVSTSGLDSLKTKLQDFIKANKELSPENMQAIVEAIEKINTEQTERNPFSTLASSFNALQEANILLKQSQEEYNATLAKGADEEKKNAQAKLDNAKAAKQKAQAEATESLQASVKKMQEYKQAAGETLGVLESFGLEVPEWLGKAMGGIDDMLGGIEKIDLTKPMSILTGSLQTIKGLATTIVSVGGLIPGLSGADYSSYNKMVDEYNRLNEIWDQIISKKQQYISQSYGEEAAKVAKEAEELQQKAIDSYYTLGRERLNSGASAGSSSIGVRQRKNMSDEGWEQAKAALGDDFWANGIHEGRMTGLFDLSTEQLANLQANAPTFWAKLDGDVREYLNSIIEGAERLEEIQEQVKESLTQVSFNSVFDSFVDTLMDMDSSAQDFADDFSTYLQRAILTTMMGEVYQDRLQEWYDKFADANEDSNITADEYQALQDEYNQIVADAVADRDRLKGAMGWESSSSSSQNQGSSRSYQTMDQDTGNELNGRFTAFQASNEEIKNQAIIQSGLSADQLRVLQELYSMTYSTMSEHSDMMIEMIDILYGIKKDTSSLPKMERLLEQINDNTKNL